MKSLILFISVLIFSVIGQAQGKQKKQAKQMSEGQMQEKKYQAPWGMAGCDLWAGVIKGQDRNSQLGVYALRNLVLNSQTSAITSGTSGCVEKSMYSAQVEQEVFVDINLASLQVEAAQGSGPMLGALAEIFGCSDRSSFYDLSKVKYQAIYKSQDAKDIISNYQQEIKASKLANQCARVG